MPERRETWRNRTAQGAKTAAGGGDLAHRRGRLKTAKNRLFKAFFGENYPQNRFFSKIFRFSACICFFMDYIKH